MKPLDARLLKYAQSAKGVFVGGAALGLLRTLSILGWTFCLASAVAAVVGPNLRGDHFGDVLEMIPRIDSLPKWVGLALVCALVRAVSTWGMDVLAARGALKVKHQLRVRALDAVDNASSATRMAESGSANFATTLGHGLDALDSYFSDYVPKLLLTAVATPVLVIVLLFVDPLSGVIVVCVLPVIPVFMALIGLATKAVQDRQWDELQKLSANFLDIVTGLLTLKIFRRESHQVERIKRETQSFRAATMRVLRVTFLSGFVLDLAGTFSIALVAVTVGTRLISGEVSLLLGLFVLLLLPEAFVPLRQVGAAFHSSAEGVSAAEAVFQLIEHPDQLAHDGARPDTTETAQRTVDGGGRDAAIFAQDLEVRHGEGILVGPVSLSVRPGEVVALTGPSGAGKSTVLDVLLGLRKATAGTAKVFGDTAWVGQDPGLLQGTLLMNVALGDSQPNPRLAQRALSAVGLSGLELGLELGSGGVGLSGGQAQRVSIARALYRCWQRDAAVLLVDEPTSALDDANERTVTKVLRAEAASGRAVLLVSHRPGMISAADREVSMPIPVGGAS